MAAIRGQGDRPHPNGNYSGSRGAATPPRRPYRPRGRGTTPRQPDGAQGTGHTATRPDGARGTVHTPTEATRGPGYGPLAWRPPGHRRLNTTPLLPDGCSGPPTPPRRPDGSQGTGHAPTASILGPWDRPRPHNIQTGPRGPATAPWRPLGAQSSGHAPVKLRHFRVASVTWGLVRSFLLT